MTVGLILVLLAVLAVIAVVVVNRVTGPRPDRPMAGKEDDTREHDDGAQRGDARAADRLGDPGQEGMNPEQAGDPTPGPPHEDDPPHPTT